MTRYKLMDNGLIAMLPGADVPGEAMDVLGRALCQNTAKLARNVGVPEDQILHCKKGNTAIIEHNLKATEKWLEQL